MDSGNGSRKKNTFSETIGWISSINLPKYIFSHIGWYSNAHRGVILNALETWLIEAAKQSHQWRYYSKYIPAFSKNKKKQRFPCSKSLSTIFFLKEILEQLELGARCLLREVDGHTQKEIEHQNVFVVLACVSPK